MASMFINDLRIDYVIGTGEVIGFCKDGIEVVHDRERLLEELAREIEEECRADGEPRPAWVVKLLGGPMTDIGPLEQEDMTAFCSAMRDELDVDLEVIDLQGEMKFLMDSSREVTGGESTDDPGAPGRDTIDEIR